MDRPEEVLGDEDTELSAVSAESERQSTSVAMNEAQHLLVCLMEECSEVVQACSKALRFGLDDDHQAANPDIVSPRLYIEKELNDLFAVTGLLCDIGVLPKPWIDGAHVHAKREKLKGMMAYAHSRGTLNKHERETEN